MDKTADNSATYDQELSQKDPSGPKGIFTAWDLNNDFVLIGQYVIWDRAKRGPMTGLSAYYIVAMKIPGSVIKPNGAGRTTKQMSFPMSIPLRTSTPPPR